MDLGTLVTSVFIIYLEKKIKCRVKWIKLLEYNATWSRDADKYIKMPCVTSIKKYILLTFFHAFLYCFLWKSTQQTSDSPLTAHNMLKLHKESDFHLPQSQNCLLGMMHILVLEAYPLVQIFN